MTIITVRDEAHWHTLRAMHLGGSDVAALFGLSPYTSKWQLWMEKAGKLAPEDLSGNMAVQAGKFLEAGIANWAASKWGMTISKVEEYHAAGDVIAEANAPVSGEGIVLLRREHDQVDAGVWRRVARAHIGAIGASTENLR